MRLLTRDGAGEIYLEQFIAGNVPPYAILSHTWGAQEVTLKDMMDGTAKGKLGYEKIQFCSDQASRDNLYYFWVDTCCIDKSSSAELQEAINSMFRWYREAAKCYVYLADVSIKRKAADELSKSTWESAFGVSRWFTRGWTLQELLAPGLVEFFSREGIRLGDKRTLEQIIHDKTGIPLAALQNNPLSGFTVRERMAWAEKRETTCKEDKAYSLLGIFDVCMPLIYGEGEKNAYRRLLEEIKKASKSEQTYDQLEDRCLADLRSSTDPRDDKIRIEETKGGLLRDSYSWVLDNDEFRKWYNENHSQLLWIKGNPGKGKTMLLCGIIDELKTSTKLAGYVDGSLLSYFFCQATDSRINNATAVIRGLIYLLLKQQPSLISHIRTKYNDAGKALFEDVNAWAALSEMLTKILEDSNLPKTYLIIDALDECITDLSQLLRLVVRVSSANPGVKWIVSSRNWPAIEEQLDAALQKTRLCLELNENSISNAVNNYISYKVDQLATLKKYDSKTSEIIQRYLHSNANNTFLWVALVCQDLASVSRWKAVDKLNTFSPDLDTFYQQMVDQIRKSGDEDLCKQILAVVSTVYRPISLNELTGLIKSLDDISDDYESLAEIIRYCGCFLVLREQTIFFVHQSAKDFLLKRASSSLFTYEAGRTHYDIFSYSLVLLSKTLRRDIYNLKHPGSSIEDCEQPQPDPLAKVRYSCVHWVDHLNDSDLILVTGDFQDGGSVDKFLRRSYLYWLEALSLLRSMSAGVLSMVKLEGLFKIHHESQFSQVVRDMHRFIQYYKGVIGNCPLQVYTSALIFSPAHSITRNLFRDEEPSWIITKPVVEDKWSACIQILSSGDDKSINSVVFSPDGQSLASASDDSFNHIRLWDLVSGTCTQTLRGHRHRISSLVFSPDGHLLASVSHDHFFHIIRLQDDAIRLWDPVRGTCLQTLIGYAMPINSIAFSPNSQLLASGSDDFIIKLWNPETGACIQTINRHSQLLSVSFLPDGRLLASSGRDIEIWDLTIASSTWELDKRYFLEEADTFSDKIYSFRFSPNGRLIASSASSTPYNHFIKLWDSTTGASIQTFEYNDLSRLLVFSPNSKSIAVASSDSTVRLYDIATGACRLRLEGHCNFIRSIAFSPDGQLIASGSEDRTIRLWDVAAEAYIPMLEKRSSYNSSVTFSPNGQVLGSVSGAIVKLWNSATGASIRTIELSDNVDVEGLIFSPNNKLLGVVYTGYFLKLWDLDKDACIQTIHEIGLCFRGVAFSPDSQSLAFTTCVYIKVWSLTTWTCTRSLSDFCGFDALITFSPNGQLLASTSWGIYIQLWDLATGDRKQTLECHYNISALAFLPDGHLLASKARDHTMKLWDIATGVCIKTIYNPAKYPLSFDSTGSRLVTRMGSIALNSYLGTDQMPITPNKICKPVKPQYCGYGISPDGKWILWNGKNVLWLPLEYRPAVRYQDGDYERRRCLAIAGERIAIGCESGQVLIFGFAAEGPPT